MKLLVLLSRVPWPLEKGDKVRAYHQIVELSKNHEIILCCLNDEPVHPDARKFLEPLCADLYIFKLNKILIGLRLLRGLISSKPFQVHYFYQSSIHRQIRKIIKESKPDHIYCQLIRASEYVKMDMSIPGTLDYMDAFSKGWERRISTSNWFIRFFVKAEYKKLVHYEHLIFDYFDNHSIISEQDRDCIIHPNRNQIAVIPNGIDTAYFRPKESAKDYDLLFTGNMSYLPNVKGAIFLVKEILPLLPKNIRVLIAGASPHHSVTALSNDQVSVSGWVEDIRDSYASSQVFVAPMELGSGLQNKLLEAMSMGLPCITSELANNALGAEEGKEILIGRSPQEYALHIQNLLKEADFSQNIALAGQSYVMKSFSWKETTQVLSDMMSK